MLDDDPISRRRSFSVQEALAGGNPYPDYAWFRAHEPVYVGQPGWPVGRPQVALFRYEEIMRWLKDPRMIRRFTKLEEVQLLRKLQRWQPPDPDTFDYVSQQYMLFQDPPEHTRLRKLAGLAFTSQLAVDRRAEVERIASNLLTTFRTEHGGNGDLIQAVAYPFPMLVMARLFGIPDEEVQHFRAWSAVVGSTVDSGTDATRKTWARVNDATLALCEYVRSIVARRRTRPEGDFVSELIAVRDEDGEGLTQDELVAMCMLMITAGHETMANVIGNGTLALMRHRDQWDRLVADPSLASNAADELIRFDSPIQFTGRIAGEDVEIGGVQVSRGSEVLFMLGSANRDETIWDQADVLRIDRKVGRHMGFGFGVHFCMGVPLARLQAETVFRTLAINAPKLELTDPAPQWRPVLHGLQRLDVHV